MAETFGVILVLFGIALFFTALWALIWPLPKLRMSTPRAATVGLVLSVGSCVTGSLFIPQAPKPAPTATTAEATAPPVATKPKKPKQSRAERRAAKERAERAELKQQALSGWREVLATVSTCDAANTRLADSLGGASSGGASIYQAYELATSAASACQSAWLGLSRLKPPEAARGEVREEFEEALETCQTAYFIRKESLETAQSIFDGDFRPSAISKFKEQASGAQGGVLACVAGYMTAAGKAGVELKELSAET